LQEIDALGQRVVDLLQQAKQQEATRTLHTFKGLSLTVGANLLSDVCRQCELQLKAVQRDNLALDDASCQHIKVGLDNAVAHTQLALRAVLAQLDEGRPVSVLVAPLDQTALVADLRVLQSMLTRSDLQALDRYAALSDSHPSLQSELQDLHQAIKIFDFPQAVVQCEKLIRTFSAPIRR
jgi:chemotaxis protein histidine kinase CheA